MKVPPRPPLVKGGGGFESYLLPKKDDLPQRAQRKFEIKQEDKLLFSALLCALVK
jgi:hypothetical protein